MINRLKSEMAAKQAEQDKIRDDNKDPVAERTAHLLENVQDRNVDLWMFMEVDNIDIPWSTYEAVEVKDRDIAWITEHASMLAAAQYQAALEMVIPDILDHGEKWGEKLDAAAKAMSMKQLQTEIKQGMKKINA